MRRADRRTALRALPAALRPAVERVARAGDALGLGVLLVGGPVRDLLLGRPLLDVDLLVEPRAPGAGGAHPATHLARAAAESDERIVAHVRFGTVSLLSARGSIDLAAARAERYAADGALPSVRPATLAQDLWRRDFSVNALALPLNAVARKGRPALVDLVGGQRDLARGILRILHERSFHDDPTRAFRAARLAARLGFRLERKSRAALGAALAAGAFDRVSGERFRAELERTFQDGQGDLPAALSGLERWRVLPALARGLAVRAGARAALRWLGLLLRAPPAGLAPDALLAGLMVWLAPLPLEARRRTLARLALSGRPEARVRGFPTLAKRVSGALARSRGRGADDVVLRALPAEELLALAAGAAAGVRRRMLRHAHEDRALTLPVDGDDLVALGLAGAAIGQTLAALRRAFLDGGIADREQALAFVQARSAPGRTSSPATGVTRVGHRRARR